MKTVTRWAIYRPDPTMGPGTMVLAFAAQGRDTYATREEAESDLESVRNENSPNRIREVMGCDPSALAVLPVKCWTGHFDPVGIYADDPKAGRQ